MKVSRTRMAASIAIAMSACCAAKPVWAQDTRAADRANAVALFDEASALEDEGKLVEACPKYAESYRLDPKLGALLHTADCFERIGQIASAYAAFREAAELASNSGDNRLEVANERSRALEAKVPRLQLKVQSRDAGLELTKDGRAVAHAQWGTALPVDPGTYTIEAKAPGKEPWKTTATLAADGKTVTLQVPPLKDTSSSAIAPTAGAQGTSGIVINGANQPPEAEAQTSSSNQKTLGWVIAGVGALGVGAGTYFTLQLNSKNNQSDSICPAGTPCSPQDHAHYDSTVSDAKSARTMAITSFAVGGAALIGGAALLFTAPRRHSTALHFSPILEHGRVGAALQGAF